MGIPDEACKTCNNYIITHIPYEKFISLIQSKIYRQIFYDNFYLDIDPMTFEHFSEIADQNKGYSSEILVKKNLILKDSLTKELKDYTAKLNNMQDVNTSAVAMKIAILLAIIIFPGRYLILLFNWSRKYLNNN